MIKRNSGFSNLSAGYLFPEIARRRREYLAAHPGAKLISLGIGNTTEPLTEHIDAGLVDAAAKLATGAGYSGYGDEQGLAALREKIAEVVYGGRVLPEEVFVSDGAKCDIGRLQLLFGSEVSVAVQDPSYPVYVDGSVIIGAAGAYDDGSKGGRAGYEGIRYLPCTAENGFFPDLAALPKNGVFYFCSPNNPTGAVATRAQLASLVKAAKAAGTLIVFDAAYAEYIRDPSLPKSIFEIEGARDCAVEVNSFSKPIGFTGVRLGWTVVPKELKYADGSPVISDWNRICTTVFNGASNIAQYGGLASLDAEGQEEMRGLVDFYLGNAKLIRAALEKLGVQRVGGDNAPYIWAHFPGRRSWDVFAEILDRCHVVTTPGSGFGPAGEGYVRFSAFGHRADVEEACARLAKLGREAVPVRLIITGGTFDKRYDELKGVLAFKDSHLPDILRQARVTEPVELEINQLVDSLEMGEEGRRSVLDACAASKEDRIVITHGTDRMVETARLLGGAGLGKTIVLTGAMVPYSVAGSDALFNLGRAFAASGLLGRGVYIAMNGRVFGWDRVRKNYDKGVFEEL